jgi:cobalt-zinc-cadmium efflux system outer membrane protein
MMRRLRAGALALAPSLLAGCASFDDADVRASDAASVASESSGRLGRSVRAPSAEDDAVAAAAVQALLAKPLDEDAAVAVALARSGEVRAAYADVGVARAEFVQAGLLRNPVLSGNTKHFDSGTEIEGALVLPIVGAFLRPLRRRAAESSLAAEQARAVRAVVGVAFDVRRAYAEVRRAQDRIQIAADALGVAESSERLMKRLHDAGNVTGLAAARENAAVARARLDVHAAEMELRDARERLTEVLGLWGDDVNWQMAPGPSAVDPPAFDFAHVESRAIRASLDLAEERAEIERTAQAAGLLSWEGLFPSIDAGVATKREASDGWGLGPDVAIELPIFDSGRARVAGAEAELSSKLATYASRAISIRSAARRLRDRYLSLAERETYLRKSYVTARERITHETLLIYNAMQVGAFDVLAARHAEFDARRELLDTRVALELTRLDVEELLAGRHHRERIEASGAPAADGGESPAQGAGGH